jgi:hypothetical protein
MVVLRRETIKMQTDVVAMFAGLAAALPLAIIVVIAPRVLQTDGVFSTAKLQFLIWTEVVLFTFGFLFTAHAAGPAGVFGWCEKQISANKPPCPTDYSPTDKGPKLPQELLLLMGLSITTAAASRAKGQPPAVVAAVKTGVASSRLAFIKDADADELSLAKLQMLAWTVVAAAAYLFSVFAAYPAFANATATSYPNVDGALLALLGLSQGAFVANRIVNKSSTD